MGPFAVEELAGLFLYSPSGRRPPFDKGKRRFEGMRKILLESLPIFGQS
jgi:hypothetical protein